MNAQPPVDASETSVRLESAPDPAKIVRCSAIVGNRCCGYGAFYRIMGPNIDRLACNDHVSECLFLSLNQAVGDEVRVRRLDAAERAGRENLTSEYRIYSS